MLQSTKIKSKCQSRSKINTKTKLKTTNIVMKKNRLATTTTTISKLNHTSSSTTQLHPNDSPLTQLRTKLTELNIDALYVPLSDPHLSEYIPKHDQRLEYISKFSGSAGSAIVTQDNALLWTDGRYFLQANQELSSQWTLMKQGLHDTPTITQYLINTKPKRFGFDPSTISIQRARQFKKELIQYGIEVIPLNSNPIDQVWGQSQPKLQHNNIQTYPIQFAGETTQSKLTKLRTKMNEKNAKAMIICALDEIAWLTNLRGSDIDCNPVFLSYAIITPDNFHLFVDEMAYKNGNIDLSNVNATIHPYTSIFTFMKSLTTTTTTTPSLTTTQPTKIWIDQNKTNDALLNVLELSSSEQSKLLILESNPIALLKSIKNQSEINGSKAAHLRDGTAMVKFLSWFESQYPTLPTIDDPIEIQQLSTLNEYTLATKLLSFRQQQDKFVGISFDTISSIGPNGAIIHYKPDENTSLPITGGNVFLLDSGGQYLDGTTDITRTFYIPSQNRPKPTDFQIEMNTRVLQGHITLSSAIFPPQTMGPALDTLARSSLWQVGTDFQHGTGHQVGSYLNVHEGPGGIAKMNRGGLMCSTPLQPNMIFSNEPGYYHDGEFGIRIENLVYVIPKETKYNKTAGYMTFENLTMVPIDRQLIDKSLLNVNEIQWVNDYHATVRTNIMPLIQDDSIAVAWLNKNTKPL